MPEPDIVLVVVDSPLRQPVDIHVFALRGVFRYVRAVGLDTLFRHRFPVHSVKPDQFAVFITFGGVLGADPGDIFEIVLEAYHHVLLSHEYRLGDSREYYAPSLVVHILQNLFVGGFLLRPNSVYDTSDFIKSELIALVRHDEIRLSGCELTREEVVFVLQFRSVVLFPLPGHDQTSEKRVIFKEIRTDRVPVLADDLLHEQPHVEERQVVGQRGIRPGNKRSARAALPVCVLVVDPAHVLSPVDRKQINPAGGFQQAFDRGGREYPAT